MLLDHNTAFADHRPVRTRQAAESPRARPLSPRLPLPPRTEISALPDGTMLETRDGWRAVETLGPGDAVATLDGGFAMLTGLRRRRLAPGRMRHWRIPAGTFNTCSDLRLSAGQHIALAGPECDRLFGAPCVLAPIATMAGFRGIAPLTGLARAEATELRFASEEIVYAQTGALLHVPSGGATSFFRTLGYGETRALLSLMNGAHCGFDPYGFAPALAA